jgi:hypothetical protein
MTSTRMAMGAAVISCVSAAMMTGALAQENTTNGHFNARAGGNHMSATGQLNGTARQSERPAVSGHANARLGGNHMMATGQPNGQRENETCFRSEGRIGNVQMRERRGFAEERTIGRERLGPMASEGRYVAARAASGGNPCLLKVVITADGAAIVWPIAIEG